MPINPNMERWVFASVAKHFDSLKGTYHLHIDGQKRTYQGKAAWAELKILGPTPKQRSGNDTIYFLGIVIFCNVVINSDQHAIRRISGHFLSTLDTIIKVYKLGDGAVDDGSYIGCFVLRSDLDRPIDRIDYGQVDAETQVQQTALEAQYQMEQP